MPVAVAEKTCTAVACLPSCVLAQLRACPVVCLPSCMLAQLCACPVVCLPGSQQPYTYYIYIYFRCTGAVSNQQYVGLAGLGTSCSIGHGHASHDANMMRARSPFRCVCLEGSESDSHMSWLMTPLPLPSEGTGSNLGSYLCPFLRVRGE
jgi:hypothetical protein